MAEQYSIDPVCGMKVGEPAKIRCTYRGKHYAFCNPRCKERFLKDPESFLEPGKKTPETYAPGTVFICPMDPEVRFDHPAPCPICGMALEPETPTAGDDSEYRIMRRKWIAATVLTGLTMAIGHAGSASAVTGYLQGIMVTIMLALPARFLLTRGIASIRTLKFNMFTLILLGIGTAWGISWAALLWPGWVPDGLRRADGMPQLFFDPAAMIAALILLGQMLEARARFVTGGAIRGLLKLSPETACRVNAAGGVDTVPAAELKTGDLIRVRPGDRIPADGVIRTGSGAVDESLLTGESLPVEREPGDRVTGGTILMSGHLDFVADRVGGETALARIIALVNEARRYRAPVQQLVDRVAAWFVPAVVTAAVTAWGVWTFGCGRPEQGLEALLAVLLVACPCALGLATPMSLVVGIGAGARCGVLVRNAGALEKLARADVMMLDKTGTLTRGRPAIRAIEPLPGHDNAELLQLAASVERFSRHPLAKAVVRAAERSGTTFLDAVDFVEFPGGGTAARIGDCTIRVGSPAWMKRQSLTCDMPTDAPADASVIAVMRDTEPIGFLIAADEIRPEAASAVAGLRAQGIRLVLLTGDREPAARYTASQLGIADVRAGVLPEEKYQAVKAARDQQQTVVMVGDGINDAAALTAADVGIAMGGGTDAAMENAGIVLPGGDIGALLRACHLSRAITRNIRQNLFFAFFYNLLMVPLAAGVFYPLLGWMFHPVLGSLAMSLSSISVITNALRLRRVKF